MITSQPFPDKTFFKSIEVDHIRKSEKLGQKKKKI